MNFRQLGWSRDRDLVDIRAALDERRERLISEVEVELLRSNVVDVEQAAVLNRRLKQITDEANVRIMTALSDYPHLAVGGKWHRRAVFEAPRLAALPSVEDKRRARVADIDARIRRAHATLRQLWRNNQTATRLRQTDTAIVVDKLMRPALTVVANKEMV